MRAKVKSSGWFSQLLAVWNAEIFSNHNKTIGNLPEGEGETIELVDDAAEIAQDMEGLSVNDLDVLSVDRDVNETVMVYYYKYYQLIENFVCRIFRPLGQLRTKITISTTSTRLNVTNRIPSQRSTPKVFLARIHYVPKVFLARIHCLPTILLGFIHEFLDWQLPYRLAMNRCYTFLTMPCAIQTPLVRSMYPKVSAFRCIQYYTLIYFK